MQFLILKTLLEFHDNGFYVCVSVYMDVMRIINLVLGEGLLDPGTADFRVWTLLLVGRPVHFRM